MKKISFFKRAAAACAAAAVAATAMSGCTSASQYPMSAGDTKVNAGVYINYVIGEMNNQVYALYYSGEISDPSECFSKDIEGENFTDVVKNSAVKRTKEFMAVNEKFDEFGLSLTDEDIAAIEASVDSNWAQNGDLLEYTGVSRESYKQVLEASYKRQAIFDYYFAEGGVEEVSDSDVQSYVEENYIRYKAITYPKSSAEDETERAEADAEIQERFNNYLAEAEGLSFEEFDRIIEMHDQFLEEKEAEAQENGDYDLGSDTDTEEDTADDSSEADTADDSAADEDASSEDSDSEETDSDTDSEDEESSGAEDPEAEDESGDTDEDTGDTDAWDEAEEVEPYSNETIVNATDAIDTESASYNENYGSMIAAMMAQPVGEAALYDLNENYFVIFIRGDISERTDYAQDNKETLVEEMMTDVFDEMVATWAESLGIKINDKAIKKYGVRTLFDRQNDYYEKNGTDQ